MTSDALPGAEPLRSVLFVCLGNICRSPLAEGVLRTLARERGLGETLRIASAGTGAWHVGHPPDPRSVLVARRNGVSLDGQLARQVSELDMTTFDLIVAMDRSNLEDLQPIHQRAGGTARLTLLRDWDPDPGDGEVPDPYHGGVTGFDAVFEMVQRSCRALLDELAP